MRNSKVLFKSVFFSLKEVLGTGRYFILAWLFSFVVFAVSLWLNNLNLIIQVILSPLFALQDKVLFLLRLLGGITTSVTTVSAVLIMIMSVLFGINLSLIVYSFTRRKRISGVVGVNSTATLSAMVSAVFGAGCAACGTYFLGAILASLGSAGLVALLPFGGKEFPVISIGLLLLSIIWVSENIQDKNVC